MTRLARGDVEMGAGIAATNADERRRAASATLREVLDDWLGELESGAGRPEPPPRRGWRRLANGSRPTAASEDADDRRGARLRRAAAAVVMAGGGRAGAASGRSALDGCARRDRAARASSGRARRWSWTRRSSRSSRTSSCATAPRWFLMRRTRAGADERLHDRWSIGIGGHLNPGDGGLRRAALRREWHGGARRGLRARLPVRRPAQRRPTDVGQRPSRARVRGRRRRAAGRRSARRTSSSGEFADARRRSPRSRDRLETWSRARVRLPRGRERRGAMMRAEVRSVARHDSSPARPFAPCSCSAAGLLAAAGAAERQPRGRRPAHDRHRRQVMAGYLRDGDRRPPNERRRGGRDPAQHARAAASTRRTRSSARCSRRRCRRSSGSRRRAAARRAPARSSRSPRTSP